MGGQERQKELGEGKMDERDRKTDQQKRLKAKVDV